MVTKKPQRSGKKTRASSHKDVLAALEKHMGAKAKPLGTSSTEEPYCVCFSAETTGRPLTTVCTVGMSLAPMVLDDRAVDTDTARAELVAYTLPGQPVPADLVRWMAWAAAFPRGQQPPSFLGWGHTIRMEKLFDGSALTTLFFLNPPPRPDQGSVFSLEGDDVALLWLTFLSDAEHRITKQQGKGPNAVLDLFQANAHPVEFTPKRRSYV